ncbi:MAG: flavin reductase [Clostridiales bacterium]|nr:flavin reductase [Lachnospiraceae bacterium]MDD6618369.1 flavin reductase [Clostridiales bacterium]MDY4771378.1 flavin reductase [Lachnospiraceae bacterium]
MDKKALYKLSYGVFMLSTKDGETVNGCITNTCMQVANSPTRIAIAVINTNYTCDLIKKSGVFALSLLDETCSFELIKHFGFQSGREVNKFENLQMPVDVNGIPYMGWQACAVISGKVISSQDLGSHTLFIAEVVDAKLLNDNAPLTYDDYQTKVKPKPAPKAEDKKIVGWRCKICKYEYKGSELPEDFACPLCGHGADDFEPIYE